MLTTKKVLPGLFIAIVAGIALYFVWFHSPTGGKEGVSEQIIASPPGEAQYELAVLFIGNSYTFYNNMPEMVAELAKADPENHTRFIVQAVTRGGIGLTELWQDGNAQKAIHARHWDYVVLQEQSFWAMSVGSMENTAAVAPLFNNEIRSVGARTLLFGTWARKPGSNWYTDPKYPFLKNSDYMLQQFDEKTNALGVTLEASVIPVGDYWAHVLTQKPELPLYSGDGSHPSPTGSYLSALVFYRFFAGHNLSQVTYVPSGVSPEDAAFLRSVVAW